MFGRHELIALAGAYVFIVGSAMIVVHAPGVLAGAVVVVPLLIFGVIVAALNGWSGTDL